MQVVLRHQELTHREATPASLQTDERFPAAQIAAVGVAVDGRFDLEDRVQAAAKAFRAAHAQARRVGAQPIDGGVLRLLGRSPYVTSRRSTGGASDRRCCRRARTAPHEFKIDIEATVERY